MPTIVFILSCDRSGSTWLGYVLGSHARCAFVGEYYRAWRPELRQPCALCLGNGKARCEVLDGIETIPAASAYDFAFQALNAEYVIDTSKRIEWAAKYVAGRSDGVRLVHLIRDPRGWYESQSRRSRLQVDEALRAWCEENLAIASFAAESGTPTATVFYDEIAGRPGERLPALCSFLGFPFEAEALYYWRKPHHAFAANGASSPVLMPLPGAADMPIFVTGDDPFYKEHGRTLFVDQRWTSTLSEEDKRRIAENTDVAALLGRYGRRLGAEGLAAAGN